MGHPSLTNYLELVGGSNFGVLTVDTNYGDHGVHSTRRDTHFSLLKTIEGALSLPCLNHVCDANVPVRDDLFGRD